MLSKLIKYDIRSTWREFAGIYMSILLGVIIVPLVFNNINNQIINMAAGFMAFAIVVAVAVVMVGSLFKIFNTNVFKKEGYLTMTLPVTSVQVVVSKLMVSSMWIILTGLVSFIGMIIFTMIISPSPFVEIVMTIQKFLAQLSGESTLTIILMIVAMIASSLKEVAKLFLACSISHLKQLNRFRVPAGILSYFVFSWLETVIVQIVVLVVGLLFDNSELMAKLNAMSDVGNIQEFLGLFNGIMGLGILYTLILTAVFSMGTVWIIDHKLDLD